MRSARMVSLLHATYRSGASALDIRRQWLRSAREPASVEHIFAYAADDSVSQKMVADGGFPAVETGPSGGLVTAVANWNAAAGMATGALLFVIADDLLPPMHWDALLWGAVDGLDPARVPFAVKVTDHDAARPSLRTPLRIWRANLLRHPIISRAYYERFGLFDPRFRGVYCDDDITFRSFRYSGVVNAKYVVLSHTRGAFAGDGRLTESQEKINARGEADHGQRVFDRMWPWYRLRPACVCLSPSAVRRGAGLSFTGVQFANLALGIPFQVLLWARNLRRGFSG
ncbi:MAG: hypothetical protein EBX36_01380 [Planctomycetia bacterium]|nr:hypothetical protein [Planctomycetia bacterium]